MAASKAYLRVRYAAQENDSFPEENSEENSFNENSTEVALHKYTRCRSNLCKANIPVRMAKWFKSKNLDETFGDIHVTLHQAARDGNAEIIKAFLDNLSPDSARIKVNQLEEKKLAPLHYAARYNHTEAVQLLLDRGADVNLKGEDGLTPLHFAARYGYIKLMKQQPNVADECGATQCQTVICMLVRKGASVNARDDYGMSPLHYAAMRGNEIATDLLLNAPQINTEVYDKQEMTPLHCAANYNHADIVEMLLDANAEPRVYDENMCTPLHLAATTGNKIIVSLLLESVQKRYGSKALTEYIEQKNNSDSNALHLSVNKGESDIVKILLDKGANAKVKRDNDTQPMHLAAISGNVDIMKYLVEHGAQVNCSNACRETPLHKAAAYNSVDAIEFLLKNKAILESRDNGHFTPLLIASAEGRKEAIEKLLENGADIHVVDKMEQSTVFWSSQENKPEALEALLKHDSAIALVNRCDRYENSPLHIAALRGYSEIVEILLDHQADIERKNEHEQTPLHMAAMHGHVCVAEKLLKQEKTLVSFEDENSNTALHLAALGGHEEMVTLLINAGATIDARNCHLWTALDCAASRGWANCCEILLKFGCPVDAVDKSKTTPLHLAAKEGHGDVLKLLLHWGANISQCEKNGKNCLDLAIDKGHENVALEILSSSDWEEVLRNESENNKFGIHQTPLRRLIRRMPDVAEFVFDKCIVRNEFPEDHPRFQITYNYEFLDDMFACYKQHLYAIGVDFSNKDSSDTSSESSEEFSGGKDVYDSNGHVKKKIRPYSDDKEILKYNHPLMLMVTHNRQNLLSHPLCMSLLQHKWESYGRYVYYANLLIFVFFLMFLTIYILTASPPCPTSDIGDPKCCWYLNSTCQPYLGKCKHVEQTTFPEVCRNFIYVFAIVHLLKEVYQMYQNGTRYLNLENFLEWSCYLSALLFVADFSECSEQTGIRQVWQWELGSISIFTAWMVLVLFISKFPFLGIYVIMFIQILSTFVNFSFVFFLFVVAFALAFYSLLQNQEPFETPGEAIVKTSVMMIGELEFDSIFNDPESKVYFEGPAYLLFVLFLLLMTIIIMNLLVGLAVDDIKGVQEQAQLKRLAMKVELVLTVERILPVMALRRCVIKEKTFLPNARKLFSGVFGIFCNPTAKNSTASSIFKTSLEELEEKQTELSKQLKSIQESLRLIHRDTRNLQALLEKKQKTTN